MENNVLKFKININNKINCLEKIKKLDKTIYGIHKQHKTDQQQ